jgi:tripartite-type tricarboxylate transporter receptor subunit TctC
MVLKRLSVACLFFLLLGEMSVAAEETVASEYPNRTIRLVVPFAPGGGTDNAARLIAEKLHAKWGQPVVVENRPGAGGNIGAELVYRSEPDGYTLLLAPPPPLVINENLYSKISFQPDRFVPISLISTGSNILVAHPSFPAKDLRTLIEYAKQNPGKVNYASQGYGTTSHLTGEMFASMANVQLTHVPYKGTGPALADLIGGQVDIMFSEITSAIKFVKSGKLQVLAVGGAVASPSLPDAPIIRNTLPGFLSTTSSNLVAPPGTPAAIVKKLSLAISEAMKDPVTSSRLIELSAEPVGSSPEEHAAYLQEERKRWGDVIRRVGIKLD